MNRVVSALIPLLFVIAGIMPGKAQQRYPGYDELWFYRVWFSEKTNSISEYSPEELLSPAAIARREKYGIPLVTESDIPVSSQHIRTLTGAGFRLRCTSKWLNTALFTTTGAIKSDIAGEYPFIDSIQLVKHPVDPVKRNYSKYGITEPGMITDKFDPRLPLNGDMLHKSGLTGLNITIAVLDAGFINADKIEALEPLRKRGGIITTRDFINSSSYVYDYHTHGTSVLSILAGAMPGIINGTAPGAKYMLLRTEDVLSEFPVEEDYWIAAAEYADSAGADIITSSLGYFEFDDPSMDYPFSDMDGDRPFITRGADMASSKGILVVNSAGNERNKAWLRIIAPSDGDSVLCVGAVNHDLTISDFSSAGYSSDGRVKPDMVAPGVLIPLQFEPGVWHSGSGTSFSCPVISGLSASLMQAVPDASPLEIINALRKSSDRYTRPDSLYGYGLPDFLKTLRLLEDEHTFRPEAMMSAGPNPFTDEILVWFHEPPGSLTVTITGTNGTTILARHFPAFAARLFRLDGLGSLAEGFYLVRIVTDQGEEVYKMIRTDR
ncbi:MAG TPA: S8 family serine peptidase [Bacteroidales bacterium]|jgi:subtilisin family serine protease|nr:S8 family serine peptidase [Bacteroidales bacterium]MDI9532539.1 S8 family serine peptidase [Bacteroidota bacterium]OPZ57899.1 MAG: Serine protease AprX [Bacteroidetes bacterium ADurb.BinA012]MBP7035628.1 S8 family serine peptidase [Bacteroidales bacterium]MBP8709757.1 S8 family serine peptidase [Bacteroidales bacterium]